MTVKLETCVPLFGSGVTDLERLFTSFWTSVKILLRLSTFSLLALLICNDRDWSRAGTRTEILHLIRDAEELSLCFKSLSLHNKLVQSYVFERRRDWLCFVLLLQVFARDLKHVLLLLAFLLVLCHVT